MSKKKKNRKTDEFPNYTFDDGPLAGEDVKSLIGEGVKGIERITQHIGYKCSEDGNCYYCSGSIVYELSKAMGSLVEEHKGNERKLLTVLDDLCGAICWLPPLVYLASQKFGYDNKWDLLTTEKEDDLRLALESLRDLMQRVYVDNPLTLENDPRFDCVDIVGLGGVEC